MRRLFPVILLVLSTGIASANTGLETAPANMLVSFADHLFEQGDYYRAITEYKRLIFFYPDHELAKTARFQIALSYAKGNKFDQAIQRFQALADDLPDDAIGRRSLFMLGDTYYQKKDYPQTIDVMQRFLSTYPTDTQGDGARVKIGWSYLRQGDWQQASAEFRKIPADSPRRSDAEGLAEDVKAYPDIPRKSPYLAGGLSAVLPGAGQLYVERPADAAISFLLNGLFIWATIEAFHNDDTVAGCILLFFESGWYLGNVYNAMNSAHKYNRRSEQSFLDHLSGQYGLTFYRDGRGINQLAFTMRF